MFCEQRKGGELLRPFCFVIIAVLLPLVDILI